MNMTDSLIALVAALILLAAMSANVPVARLPDNGDSSGMAGARLSDLAHGARAQGVGISSQCRGLERRRPR